MRFQQSSTPPPFLNRRHQYRMLGMVVLLVLVLATIEMARRPESWNWFFFLSQGQSAQQAEDSTKNINFQVLQVTPLPPETFVAVAPDKEGSGTEDDSTVSQIAPRVLDGIQDRRVGWLRRDEEALHAIGEQLEAFTPEQRQQAVEHQAWFRVVNVEPDDYRGRLIGLEGTLWQLTEFPAPGGQTRDHTWYQAWILTSDSGNQPWVVLLRTPPAGLQMGTQLNRHVEVVGYFLKRYGYATETGMNVAPLLVAETLHVQKQAAAPVPQKESYSIYVIGGFLILAILVGAALATYAWSDRRFARSRLSQIAESRLDASPEARAAWQSLQEHDVASHLKQIQDSGENDGN